MRIAFFLLALAGVAWAADPELPRVFLDTRVVPGGGRTIAVAAGGDLQAAINAAAPGDTVAVQAGATFHGNFTLPVKSGAGWVTITTSNPGGLPGEGGRVGPANAGAMPKIVTDRDIPAIRTDGAAHHYRLVGLEVSLTSAVTYGLIQFGTGGETATAQLAHDLIIDRCYVHGAGTAQVQNGLRLASASSAIIDSYFEDCHGTQFETHCISCFNGPGPYKIVDNHLGGSTTQVMFGGAVPALNGVVPSDIEFRRNDCVNPMSWRVGDPGYAGTPWYVKNLFELKNAQRVLIEGNRFAQNFLYTSGSGPDGSAQQGYAIVISTRSENGAVPWARIQDVIFRNNTVRGSVAGMSLWGGEGQGGARMTIANNLFADIGVRWGANDRAGMFIQANTWADLQVDHDTVIHDGDILFANGVAEPGFVFTNTIADHACARAINPNYGINGGGTHFGLPSLAAYFPGYVFARNAMVASPFDLTTWYPAGQWYPSTYDAIGFVDRAGGDYRLAATSPYKGKATDGKDLGADFAAIDAAMSGGTVQPPQPPQPPTVTRAPYGGSPRAIPGTIQAEDFDEGGEGVAYHDLDPANNGGGYRATGVDIRGCIDAGAGWQVGWIGAGEWLEYTANVAAAGSYDLGVRVASGSAGGTIHVAIDGADRTGALSFGNTGGWDTWSTVTRTGIALSAGIHVVRFACDAGSLDLNWLALTAAVVPQPPVVTSNSTVIDSMDALTVTPPADHCALSLVAGQSGNAVRFAWADGCGMRFATATNTRGTAAWDTAAGISFWVKGDGSTHCGSIQMIWGDDYAQRYAFAFRIDGTAWTRVYMPWSDLLPELSGPQSVPLGVATGHPPSRLGPMNFGKWWYWRDTAASSYAIDDIRLESAIAVDATDYRPTGGALARVKDRLAARQGFQIVTMGDSLTDLQHGSNQVTNWPKDVLATAASSYGSQIALVDPAVGGTELRGNVVMMPLWLQTAPQPNLVTIFFGNNDWENGMRGAAFRQTLVDTIRRVRRATRGSADVLIMSTCPSLSKWDTMAELAQACRDAARDENAGLCDVDALFHQIAGTNPARLFAADGTHLSAEGQQRIADAVLAAIQASSGGGGGTVVTNANRSPYGGAARAIPGTLQAEDFDEGGEGVAYHDLDPANNGGGYRATGVDIRACVDAGGGWQVGWFGADEWMEYAVNVAATGSYDLAARIANGSTGGTIHVAIDGADRTGALTFGNTGGWDTWVSVPKAGIALTAGAHVVRVVCDAGGLDLNWIAFNASPSGIVSGQWYQVIAKHSGKCLAIEGSSTANAANAWQWHDDGTTGEQWRLDAVADGVYTLTARCSGQALDMAGWSTVDGGDAIQWPLHGGDNQRWRIEATGGGFYRLVNVASGKVLDVAGVSTDDGANVQQWTDVGGDNQRWSFVPVAPSGSG